MTYDVEINGRLRRVGVERAPAGYVVTVDGHRRAVDVIAINGALSLIVQEPEAPSRSYEVAIAEQPPGTGVLTVYVSGRVVTAAVERSRGSWARRGHEGAHGSGPHQVVSPMPGKVVKVLVKPGDTVAARQGVVVVEAMKMENELRSTRAGTVAAVTAIEGQSVEAGAVLVVIA